MEETKQLLPNEIYYTSSESDALESNVGGAKEPDNATHEDDQAGSSSSQGASNETYNEVPGFTSSDKKRGCVMCRTEYKIEKFDELKPGDQIAVRGQVPCLGFCYDHHAIVTRVEPINDACNTANILVIDVNEKRMRCVGCKSEDCTCCFFRGCKRLSFCKCRYPIQEHPLCDKLWRLSSSLSHGRTDPNVRTDQIRRLDYKKRRNDKETTLRIARGYKQLEGNNVEYCFFVQNCEHCVSACVNGPENPNEEVLRKSISIQSYTCFWRLAHFVFWLLQTLFYALDFYVYAVFVANDPDFNIFPPSVNATLIRICVNTNDRIFAFISILPPNVTLHRKSICPDSEVTSDMLFDTTCNWKFIGIFGTVFIFLFIIGLFVFYQPLYTRGFICRLCLITARIDCFSRILALLLVETISIIVEDPLYLFLTCGFKSKEGWTVVLLVVISIAGALTIYSVASVISWVLGMCCIPTCQGAIKFTKFFQFRGLAYLVACCMRKICCFVKNRCHQRRIAVA